MKRRYRLEGLQERLADLWLKSKLTQKDVAQRVGFERKTVGAWMKGDSEPNTVALARLCVLFNVSADYLLFGKEK